MQMRARLGMHDQTRATGFDVARGEHVRGENHEVGLERLGSVSTRRVDDIGTEGEVRNELSVHHVPLKVVDSRRVERLDFGSESGEIAGQH